MKDLGIAKDVRDRRITADATDSLNDNEVLAWFSRYVEANEYGHSYILGLVMGFAHSTPRIPFIEILRSIRRQQLQES